MKVSVCIITYNHEGFISQAIESALSQQTSFDFEIVICEDHSKDHTRQICETYAKTFPGKINLLPSTGNLGLIRNFARALQACRGSYIAFLEGDDFWTDNLKLQVQTDFMDKQADCSICFHNVNIHFNRSGENAIRPFHASLPKDTFTTEDLLAQWFIPSASVMFRNYSDLSLPDWFFHCKSGDIPYLLLLSLKGNIRYIDTIMAAYRVHDNGVSSTHRGYDKIISMIYIYESFDVHTNYRFHGKIKEAEIYEIDRHYPANSAKPKELTAANSSQSFGKRILSRLSGMIRTGNK